VSFGNVMVFEHSLSLVTDFMD